MKDYYAILDLSPLASPDDIKRAFHKLAHQHHPDLGGDGEKFKAISEAYAALSNPAKRQEYDAQLRLYAQQFAQQQVVTVVYYYPNPNGTTDSQWYYF
jgi:curved DNA-binding protein CbpA